MSNAWVLAAYIECWHGCEKMDPFVGAQWVNRSCWSYVYIYFVLYHSTMNC